ncbi:hypothetical protein QBC41DRAFT_299488 [Cercophora samala]|uniref:Uncharacterized protein n=1 Tax=Cercophora samala TaxID=330535 RepID=A0AA40DF07_9PEZI|nr:hypothetical protein QBC41DRAFT_299488 [Cercophora samala]
MAPTHRKAGARSVPIRSVAAKSFLKRRAKRSAAANSTASSSTPAVAVETNPSLPSGSPLSPGSNPELACRNSSKSPGVSVTNCAIASDVSSSLDQSGLVSGESLGALVTPEHDPKYSLTQSPIVLPAQIRKRYTKEEREQREQRKLKRRTQLLVRKNLDLEARMEKLEKEMDQLSKMLSEMHKYGDTTKDVLAHLLNQREDKYKGAYQLPNGKWKDFKNKK